MIIKTKNKYKVISHITGRSFGTYRTKKKALKRLRQIKMFSRIKQQMKGGEK